jgi:GT2 family glycosyltransferase
MDMGFEHPETLRSFDNLDFGHILRITHAATAACALVRKDAFLKAGGFDEIWYPIAYSDTDLARKLRRLGYLTLYTPYAYGTHHESITRGTLGQYEEMERSRWLFMQRENQELGNSEFLPDTLFDYPNSNRNDHVNPI